MYQRVGCQKCGEDFLAEFKQIDFECKACKQLNQKSEQVRCSVTANAVLAEVSELKEKLADLCHKQ